MASKKKILTPEQSEAARIAARKWYAENKEKKRLYYQENKETILEKHKAWANNNSESLREKRLVYYKENRDAIIAKAAKWASENRDVINARTKELRVSNPERHKEYSRASYRRNTQKHEEKQKQWREKNRERFMASVKNNYVKRKRLIGGQKIAAKFSKEIIEIYANRPAGYHVDHIIPLRG